MKGKAVGEEKYENFKILYAKLKMRDMSDLIDLYNAKDVIWLCESFENHFQIMYEKNMYNPRKINSASKLSGCIQKEQSKMVLASPTKNNVIEVFGETVTGGFRCVNTRLSFDTEILMPNLTKSNYSKMSIDESFKAYKKDDVKAIYDIKLNNKKKFQKRRIISKILKLDENNQYGFAMKKSIPTGCIKEKPLPTWITFNLLIETVSLDSPIGHLSIADIKFDHENATEKQILYNDILPPVTEKHKILDPNERSVYQLLEQNQKTDNSAQKAYRCMKKSEATLFPKKIIPLCLEN